MRAFPASRWAVPPAPDGRHRRAQGPDARRRCGPLCPRARATTPSGRAVRGRPERVTPRSPAVTIPARLEARHTALQRSGRFDRALAEAIAVASLDPDDGRRPRARGRGGRGYVGRRARVHAPRRAERAGRCARRPPRYVESTARAARTRSARVVRTRLRCCIALGARCPRRSVERRRARSSRTRAAGRAPGACSSWRRARTPARRTSARIVRAGRRRSARAAAVIGKCALHGGAGAGAARRGRLGDRRLRRRAAALADPGRAPGAPAHFEQRGCSKAASATGSTRAVESTSRSASQPDATCSRSRGAAPRAAPVRGGRGRAPPRCRTNGTIETGLPRADELRSAGPPAGGAGARRAVAAHRAGGGRESSFVALWRQFPGDSATEDATLRRRAVGRIFRGRGAQP